jgi:hypothetical protein
MDPEIPLIHNLTGWEALVKAGNPIPIVGRIFRIKRTAGERAGFAMDRPRVVMPNRRPTLRDKVR